MNDVLNMFQIMLHVFYFLFTNVKGDIGVFGCVTRDANTEKSGISCSLLLSLRKLLAMNCDTVNTCSTRLPLGDRTNFTSARVRRLVAMCFPGVNNTHKLSVTEVSTSEAPGLPSFGSRLVPRTEHGLLEYFNAT
jgi:hypothetical protein